MRINQLHGLVEEQSRRGETVEIVIDGPCLVYILGSPLEQRLAELGAKCAGVVVCRSSPSQKAAIVKIMIVFRLFSQNAQNDSGL